MLLREGQGEEAELRIGPPQVAAEALGPGAVAPAALEIVAVRHQAVDAVLEEALLLAQIEIHPLAPSRRVTARGSPWR
jgi:hypothetical protein